MTVVGFWKIHCVRLSFGRKHYCFLFCYDRLSDKKDSIISIIYTEDNIYFHWQVDFAVGHISVFLPV